MAWPPSSEPTKSQFLRLCRALHNRNYVEPRIMWSGSRAQSVLPLRHSA